LTDDSAGQAMQST